MDTMSFSLTRMRSGISRVTKSLGIQSPMLEKLLNTMSIGEGIIRTFTGSIQFLKSVSESYLAVVKTWNMLMDVDFTKAIMKAGLAIWGYIAKIGALIGAKWSLVTAQLAVLASNPFTLALAMVAIASIAMIVSYVGSLRRETERTTNAMKTLGEVTVKGSVFPDMLEWMKKIREETRKPIEIKVDVTTTSTTRGRDVGRNIGEYVAFEVARRRRE